jgi:hypothetical protein
MLQIDSKEVAQGIEILTYAIKAFMRTYQAGYRGVDLLASGIK